MMEKETSNGFTLSKHLSSKIEVIESNLHQTLYYFRDIVGEFEEMHMQIESIKKQMIAQKEKCMSKCCDASDELKKVISSKENIIQLVASALTKLNETKNFNILPEIYKILFGESKTLDNIIRSEKEINSDDVNIAAMSLVSPKEQHPESMSIEEEEDAVSEIEGTPNSRRSPIIQSRKLKSSIPNNTLLSDKKNCSKSRQTAERKTTKVILTYPTPTRSKGSGRLRQQRIPFVREKPCIVVDLSTDPQFSNSRNSQSEDDTVNKIKQEIIENDDTIMPSPTSGPVLPSVYKSMLKESPHKFKKPLSLIRPKAEKDAALECKENILGDVTNLFELESLDLLKDFQSRVISPNKSHIQANDSMSLLQHVNKRDPGQPAVVFTSPVKRPLAEISNAINTPHDTETSISILPREVKIKREPSDKNIRINAQIQEPLYKEPTVRKKAEKRALPGWSCDQCKNFYGEMYKDNPEMLAKKMDECSKHRGRNNPVRPKTPPGYWEPRWDVPEDTEEFNRRNNAV